MSDNHTFVSALTEAIGRPVEVSPVREATTLGAGYLGGMALGIWGDESQVAATWRPIRVVEPASGEAERSSKRQRWFEARERALRLVPELSDLEF